MAQPILIIQMQRMGDLILTFPLFLWLKREYPDHPIWVVAEPRFFKPLLSLSPPVNYCPPSAEKQLLKEKYFLVLNLSHRSEAASLAGKLKAEHKSGLLEYEGKGFYIQGKWQLYRASLVQNNRYNAFHWAELNALDSISLKTISNTVWPKPRILKDNPKKVGVFLGASEPEKRPSRAFWVAFCEALLKKGHRPILLGGKNELQLAREIKKNSKYPLLNLCARFELSELGMIGQTLDILVAADTGPMHLATWTGVRVANLSMGPVSPWDTGPYHPGNYVFRAALSCVDCWECLGKDNLCHAKFKPGKMAFLIDGLLKEKFKNNSSLNPAGIRLLKTRRNNLGLFSLDQQGKNCNYNVHLLFRFFWAQVWAYRFQLGDRKNVQGCWQDIVEKYPQIAIYFKQSLFDFMLNFRNDFKTGNVKFELWKSRPSFLRPLTGYLELFIQNEDMDNRAFNQAFNFMEELFSIVS